MSPTASGRPPLIIVVSGPGGVGKGTIVDALVGRDPRLWLSRSWTTRPQRPGEADRAYVFTDRAAFEQRIAAGGFLEWTEFLGNYYGTPIAATATRRRRRPRDRGRRRPPGQGGAARTPCSIFVLPPTRDEQERRLRGRGDAPDKVVARLQKAEDEEPVGRALADHVVVNDDLEDTIDEMLAIIEQARAGHR